MHTRAHIALSDRAGRLPVFAARVLGCQQKFTSPRGVVRLPGNVAPEKKAAGCARVGAASQLQALGGSLSIAFEQRDFSQEKQRTGLFRIERERLVHYGLGSRQLRFRAGGRGEQQTSPLISTMALRVGADQLIQL